MKKLLQKILPAVMAILTGVGLMAPALNTETVYAAGGSDKAQTVILTECSNAENEHGEGIKCIILKVVNILTILVGIVGVIGIVVVGIQYLTAGGNEEQTRKAKRRLFEIVIGLIAFVLMSALLNWLLPNFNATSNSTSLLTTVTGA